MEIDLELKTIEQDINSLKQELKSINDEIRRTQEENTILQKTVDRERHYIKKLHSKSKRPLEDDGPPIVQHSYFHDSISKYFKIGQDFEPQLINTVDIDHLSLGAVQSARKIIALKENVLYENLYRMGGLTAFPLNDKTCLGLRFDRVDGRTGSFMPPNYVILRKEPVIVKDVETTKWKVYKHTISQPLVNNCSGEEGLDDNQIEPFAQRIYVALTRQAFIEHLLHTFHKQLELAGNSRNLIAKLTADASMMHITMELAGVTKFKVNIIIDEDHVKSVDVEGNEMIDKIKLYSIRLKGVRLINLEQALTEWLQQLINDEMI